VTQADQQLHEELRRDLGASDLRYLAVLTAANPDSLQQAERAGSVLQALSRDGVLAGYSSPAQVLPSLSSQQARQAALPDRALRQRLEAALKDLPCGPRPCKVS